jgi:hypothetical protein
MEISPEKLAYWYLRLNGFLTIENFLIHPETRRDSSTDVDILGVRFPFRKENLSRPMEDDIKRLAVPDSQIYILVVEVKSVECSLNGPRTRHEKKNMQKVLAAVGALAEARLDEVASALYSNGRFQSDDRVVSLCCIGRSRSELIEKKFPEVPQVVFSEILGFVYQRLKNYQREKAQHEQWDEHGKALWNWTMSPHSIKDFLDSVKVRP